MRAEMHEYSTWIKETDPQKIDEKCSQLLVHCGFSVLGKMEQHFQPQGYSVLYLLAESHCGIHTFPEEGRTHVNLVSCNKEYFDEFLSAAKLL